MDEEDAPSVVRIVDPVVGEDRVPDGEAACVRKDHCSQSAAAVSNLGVFNGDAGSRHRLDAAGPFAVRIVQKCHGSESGRRIRTDHERSVDAVQLALLHSDVGDNDHRRPPAHTPVAILRATTSNRPYLEDGFRVARERRLSFSDRLNGDIPLNANRFIRRKARRRESNRATVAKTVDHLLEGSARRFYFLNGRLVNVERIVLDERVAEV